MVSFTVRVCVCVGVGVYASAHLILEGKRESVCAPKRETIVCMCV